MALINCPECNGVVSTQADRCPYCGYPIEIKVDDPNVFIFDDKKYDISEVIDSLEHGDITMASICLPDSLFRLDVNKKQIEIDIWNQFKRYKEMQLPNICDPSPILTYMYNNKAQDASRVVWCLDKSGGWQEAFKELYFAFDYGYVKNGTEEASRLGWIINDIQEKIEKFKQNNGDIVYPRWFTKWKENNKVLDIPKCPTCGSADIKRLDALTRGAALGLFGIASKTARSQFMCKKCGYKW